MPLIVALVVLAVVVVLGWMKVRRGRMWTDLRDRDDARGSTH